jgi:hypothetical protein
MRLMIGLLMIGFQQVVKEVTTHIDFLVFLLESKG